MQPALAELVQNSTLPASAASASARFGAMMSIPWCGPPARASPKSSEYDTVPSTGKTIVVGGLRELAAAIPARRVTRTAKARARVAVVRKRFTGGPKRQTLAKGWLCTIRAGMKIAVCAKYVPDAAAHARIDPDTKRLDRSGEGELNQFDVHAVEEALKLKESGADASEVVIVSLGPGRALEAMRKALAMGADRIVLVSDEGAAGSDLVATSRILAAALAREEPDLVLFGQQANDSDGAVLWAAVADRLQRPLISQVAEVTRENGKVRGKRQTEDGDDVIEAPLPAVVAVSDAINEPRYPSLKGIMGAKSKPQETLTLGDLGVEAG